MKRLTGGKMAFAGLSLVIAATAFLLQVDAASAGTPGVRKTPCNEESIAAQSTVQEQAVELGPPGSAAAEVERAAALGYRVPLVVKQRVPARIHGGVYMPAHETYVVLHPGHWEPEGVKEDPPGIVEAIRAQRAAKGCWLRRLFRKLGRCDGGP